MAPRNKITTLNRVRAGRAAGGLRINGAIACDLGRAIVSGAIKPGTVLDGEIEASERLRVSRTAYREAVKILAAKGLVRSRPNSGTRVSLRDEWHLLDPDVLDWIFGADPEPDLLYSLFELRFMIEPEAAAFAATRRSAEHLRRMETALTDMARHTLQSESGRQADKDFHAALFHATRNPFVISLTNGLTAAVDALTKYKQREKPLARDPVPDHRRVYEAIVAKDALGAHKAMTNLIRLAITDTPALANLSVKPRKRRA
jgi:DNA-binding FadR family transcriptional regulator